MNAFERYQAWAAEQRCVDCGRTPAEIKKQDTGGRMTETQCYRCWKKLGAPENRGLPSARELYVKDGGRKVW